MNMVKWWATSGTLADGSQANLNYAWSIDVIKPYVKLH